MSNPIRKQIYVRYESYNCYPQQYDYKSVPEIKKPIAKKKKLKKKKNFLAMFFAITLLSAYGYFVCPYNYQKYFEPLILNRFLNRNIEVDAKPYVSPTSSYLHNSFFLGEYQLTPKVEKSKEMSDIQILYEMTDTKNKLLEFNFQKRKKSLKKVHKKRKIHNLI